MLSDAVAKLPELTGRERMPVLALLVGARSRQAALGTYPLSLSTGSRGHSKHPKNPKHQATRHFPSSRHWLLGS